MFKKFKKHDNYFIIAIYAFLVIAASIALIWFVVNLSQIFGWVSGVISAMASFVYGFIISKNILHTLIYVIYIKHQPLPFFVF